MIKITVISDTHIPVNAKVIPKEVLNSAKVSDMVIHAGDLADLEVLAQLKAACKNVIAVRGNMDSLEVKNKLPEKEIIDVQNFKIGVMHGFGPPDKLIDIMKQSFKSDKVDVIIFGHSHKPFNENVNGILFFNPGSVTDKFFAPYNSYGIIEINDEIKARIVKI
jgi:hypothetical protein